MLEWRGSAQAPAPAPVGQRLSQEGLGRRLGVSEQSVGLWERTGKVPQAADSVTRMVVSEKLDGNCKASDVIERINTVEPMINQRIVVRETRRKWSSKIASSKDERFALAA